MECSPCGELPKGEQCVRYALQLVVAAAGAKVTKGPNPADVDNADISGIPVQHRIQVTNEAKGQVVRKVSIGHLCGLGSGCAR